MRSYTLLGVSLKEPRKRFGLTNVRVIQCGTIERNYIVFLFYRVYLGAMDDHW